MSSASSAARRRALRWLAPTGVVGVVGLLASGVFSSGAASRSLPRTSAAALIAQVRTSDTAGFSGTVVSTFALGLPELPSLGDDDGASLSALLVGSHTMQVWYGGADKQRVALLGATEETDMFRDGRSVWQWNSADRSAVHEILPPGTAASGLAASTPQQLARRVLAMLDSTTTVSVEHEHDVADRASYELVLTPRVATTLVGAVRISVDGDTKVPLGVQVFARGADAPAIDVGFTSIRFARPSERNFAFTPPPGARVRTVDTASAPRAAGGTGGGSTDGAAAALSARPLQVIGTGWARVVVARVGVAQLHTGVVRRLLTRAADVSGEWGHGLLVQTPLVDALVVDDGRVLIGPVEPSVLYAAARK